MMNDSELYVVHKWNQGSADCFSKIIGAYTTLSQANTVAYREAQKEAESHDAEVKVTDNGKFKLYSIDLYDGEMIHYEISEVLLNRDSQPVFRSQVPTVSFDNRIMIDPVQQ